MTHHVLTSCWQQLAAGYFSNWHRTCRSPDSSSSDQLGGFCNCRTRKPDCGARVRTALCNRLEDRKQKLAGTSSAKELPARLYTRPSAFSWSDATFNNCTGPAWQTVRHLRLQLLQPTRLHIRPMQSPFQILTWKPQYNHGHACGLL